MKSRVRGRTGFANRSFALRRCLVEILKRRDRLTTAELAYGRQSASDIIGAQLHSWSRRGALRRLVVKGKVKMIGRYRRRKAGRERSPVADAEIVLLV
jgi:hypothetical protein